MNAPTATPALTEEYRRLPIPGRIKKSKTNPRRHRDKKADAEMTKSIKAKGVVEPIIVRELADGTIELVCGERRYDCSLAAGAVDIPAVIRNYTDTEAMEVQIIENLQRKDVHAYDEAFGFKALLEQQENGKPRYDVPAIAHRIGKSVSYVYMRLKLTDLIKEAQDALLADDIDAGHAEKIARLQPEEQKQALDICLNNDLSVRDLSAWIDQNVHLDLARAVFDAGDEKLCSSAGSCIKCPKRTGTQPELFPDIGKEDTCTDPKCFQTKVKQHFNVKRQKLEAEGHKVVNISANNYSPDKNVITADHYVKADKKKCDDTKMGLIVDGLGRGEAVRVCTNKKCHIHHPELASTPSTTSSRTSTSRASTSSGSLSSNIKSAAVKARQEQDADEIVTPKAIRAVLQAFQKKPKLLLNELKLLTITMMGQTYLFDDVTDEALAALCIHHGLKAGQVDRIDMEKAIDRCKKPEQVAGWLYSLLVAHAASNHKQDGFHALAKARGVDIKKLRTEVLTQMNRKDKVLGEAAKQFKANKSKPARRSIADQVAEKLQTLAEPKAKAKTAKPKKKK